MDRMLDFVVYYDANSIAGWYLTGEEPHVFAVMGLIEPTAIVGLRFGARLLG